MKGTPNNGLSIMSVAAMRRFFYPFEGTDLPIGWMCCPTARIQKNKQEERDVESPFVFPNYKLMKVPNVRVE